MVVPIRPNVEQARARIEELRAAERVSLNLFQTRPFFKRIGSIARTLASLDDLTARRNAANPHLDLEIRDVHGRERIIVPNPPAPSLKHYIRAILR